MRLTCVNQRTGITTTEDVRLRRWLYCQGYGVLVVLIAVAQMLWELLKVGALVAGIVVLPLWAAGAFR